jgi:hypothetical protein
MQIELPAPLPGLDLPQMKSEEVEPVLASGQLDDPGLLRAEPKPEPGQDHRRPSLAFHGLLAGGTDDDKVVAVADQRPCCAVLGLPRLIEAMQGDVRQQWTDRRSI